MSQSVKQPQTIAQLGRYKNLVLLGQGGMGAVYRAEDPSLDRTVAIKVVLEDNTEFLARFHREAKSIAKLSHPSIVQVFDFGEDTAGHPFFVMELCPGQALDKLLEDHGPLPPVVVAILLQQAAQGLGAAHAAGIVHRDIKPQNMILSGTLDALIARKAQRPANKGERLPPGGETSRLKIVDFGVARVAESAEGLTTPQATVGTLHYMSPEALSGVEVDARADIYALGLVGFYLLTGRPPFTAPSAVGVAMKQINEPLPDLAKEAPGTPESLRKLIEKMAHKDRNKRIQTCADVAELAGEIAGALRESSSIGTASTMAAPMPSALRQTLGSPQGRRVMLVAGGLGLLAAAGLAVGLSKKGLLPRRVVVQVNGPGEPGLPQVLPEPPKPPVRPPEPAAEVKQTGPVRVAVMPFKNLTGDPQQGFMTEAVDEATVEAFVPLRGRFTLVERNRLDEASLGQLQLERTQEIAGQKAFDAEAISKVGSLLGAEVVVTGSYVLIEAQMRIFARFVRVQTGEILDATSITAAFSSAAEKFAIQDKIALQLREHLSALHPKLRG